MHAVLASHAEAQREARLQLLLRDTSDSSLVALLFNADDAQEPRALSGAPGAREAAQDSGGLGTAQVLFLTGF